jgi:hypothetical protein
MTGLFAGGTEIKLLPNSTAGYARINVGNTNQPLDFQMNSVDVMRITQAGDIGIGTTSPNAKLDVNGNAIVTGSLTVTQGITGSLFGTASWAVNAVSSSYALTASYLDNYIPPFPLTGSAIITGSLTVTGSIRSTLLTGSDNRVVVADPSGTLQSTSQTIIDAYIDPNGVQAGQLNTTSNWDIYGEYIGTAITDTFQGQRHYNIDYFFEAVNDNEWIRLIRG